MLNVRAAFQSDHLCGFQDSYSVCQTNEGYPHRELLGDYKPLTVAC